MITVAAVLSVLLSEVAAVLVGGVTVILLNETLLKCLML